MASMKCHKVQNTACVGRVTKYLKMDEDLLKCVFAILPHILTEIKILQNIIKSIYH